MLIIKCIVQFDSKMTPCTLLNIHNHSSIFIIIHAYSFFHSFQQSEEAPELGDIMYSLSYLPSAERLTVVILKARNLRAVKLLEDKKTSG